MDDRRDLTSGDPLGGGGERPEPRSSSLFDDPGRPAAWPGSEPAAAPVAPERPGGYGGGPVPPGAFQPRPQRPQAPAPGALAEYWRRALAVLLDGLIVMIFVFILFAIIGALIGDSSDSDSDGNEALYALLGLAIGFLLAYPIAALLYLSTMMAATNGQTLGRLATGIRVQRADGRPIGFWWAAYREVLMKGIVLGIAGTITGGIAYLVNFLWPIWDGQNRALHDIVVDSRVVKTRP
jgi:uncharacterized RDD family membrane protein YckC